MRVVSLPVRFLVTSNWISCDLFLPKATKEIRWHETRPIFSCDFQPFESKVKLAREKSIVHPYARTEGQTQPNEEKRWRLATAGGDNHIRIWLVTPLPNTPSLAPSSSSAAIKDEQSPRVEYLATLSRHAAVVNVVRFSPSGQTLASAGDDGTLILWNLSDEVPKTGFADEANEAQFATEVWKIRRSLRSTGAEIYDLAWSPDSNWLVVGSTDNTARIIRATTGDTVAQITDHNNYVQGVAWDPLFDFIATQSSDKHMHLYQVTRRQHAGNTDLTYKLLGKNAKMDVQHEKPEILAAVSSSRKPPTTSIPLDDEVQFVGSSNTTDTFKRPEPKRASSSRTSIDTERPDPPKSSELPPKDIPSSSRRSSVSSVCDSPSSRSSRPARSPSPMPPLPAIKMGVANSPNLSAASAASSPRVPTFELDAGAAPGQKPLADAIEKIVKSQQMYGGPEASPFFRRLAWSTDGSLLLTPSGQFDDPFIIHHGPKEPERTAPTLASSGNRKKKGVEKAEVQTALGTTERKNSKPTVFVYGRGNITNDPIAHLPGHKSHSIAIRFNPLLWQLRRPYKSGSQPRPAKIDLSAGQSAVIPLSELEDQEAEPIRGNFDLPYRMLYAVATHESVYVYDTQQAGPVCMFGNLHYAPFTDLSWTADGQSLVLASQDGYCSVVAFEHGELGNPLPEDQQMKKAFHHVHNHVDVGMPPSSPVIATPPVRPREEPLTRDRQSQDQPPQKKARRIALTTHAPVEAPKDGPL